jgi:hypothetical protein
MFVRSGTVGCSVLLAVVLILALALGGLGADLFVVLLEGREVLAGLGELAFLHALADIPVDERALGVPGKGKEVGGRGETEETRRLEHGR